ncbi:MAG TPA: hypothetical protein VJ738_01920 [Steroidobacteraceae bacterium]|nr:hypothetical protein [Steroidobacteraceae bacterium]
MKQTLGRSLIRAGATQVATVPRSFDWAQAATAAFAAGEYARGWELLDSRPSTRMAGLPVPHWNGQSFHGVMAVICADGLGDQILLARFIRRIKSRGAGAVVALAPCPLARLFSRIQGVDDVFPIDRIPGGHVAVNLPWRPDWYVRLGGLPRIFGCNDPTSVPRAPYIAADPADIARWRPRLPQGAGLRVGLVWRGDPNNVDDRQRSVPSFATLAPLWLVPDINFVSLQVGAGEDEVRSATKAITHLGSDVRDFADTAAVISQLDLLISVDTSTANLAGAMGRPTWVLGQPTPEFRWLHGWYPTARVFCQHRSGEWDGATADVAAALKTFSAEKARRDARDTVIPRVQ